MNLLVVTKDKLITIDGILPIVMELKKRYGHLNVIFAFTDKNNFELAKKNIHLWKCIESLDPVLMYPDRTSKLKILLWMTCLFLRLIFKHNVIVKFADNLFRHKQFVNILKRFSKTIEIKAFITAPAEDNIKGYGVEARLISERNNNESFPPEGYALDGSDYCMSPLKAAYYKKYLEVEIPEDRMINTGYVRGYPEWTAFLEKEIEEYKGISQKPYFLYILSCLDERIPEFNDPPLRDLLKESLEVLKKFNGKIRTVFRPHPLTDMAEFENILKELDYENFSIDYGHPMLLSSKAQFVIGNFYSTTMFDAFYQGVPILEYADFDREFMERLGGGSFGGHCCDFFIKRDRAELEKTVSEIINGKVKVERKKEFMEREFPEMPESFFRFFDNIFVNHRQAG